MLIKELLKQQQVKESAYMVGNSGAFENVLLRMISSNSSTDIGKAFHHRVEQYSQELEAMKHKITKDIEDSFRSNPPSDISPENIHRILQNPERLAEALLDYLLAGKK